MKEDISGRDLRPKLRESGISYGPITATTRNLYIRKLSKTLSEGKSPERKLFEIENDQSMPVKLNDESNNRAALDEIGAAEVCSCPCNRTINADLESIKLDMTGLES